jgi:8-oxo-dGTP pyrophosphatase MutT (NUDIX family)
MSLLDFYQAKQIYQKFKLCDMNSVQRALWYYKDVMNGSPKVTLCKFLQLLYQLIPKYISWVGSIDRIEPLTHRFMKYQNRLPRCGVVLFCENKVLVLKSVYGRNLMFPMGKQYRNEPSHECAMRECREETGIHVSLHEKSERFSFRVNGHAPCSLFIVHLQCTIDMIDIIPQTNYEVSTYRWVDMDWFDTNKPFRAFNKQSWGMFIHYLGHRIHDPPLLTYVTRVP